MSFKRGSFYYMNNYLNQKYENYCDEILFEEIEIKTELGLDFYNINFSTLFDKLIFVLLYEFESYDQFLEEIYSNIHLKLSMMEHSEVEFLYAKCVDKPYNNDLDLDSDVNGEYQQIANEFLKIINRKVVNHLSEYSDQILDSFLKELQSDIEFFAYDGPLEGGDYNINNYWEEFCFQIQYGEGFLLDIILGDIENHLKSKLMKIPFKDFVLLYTITDEFKYGDYHEENIIPIPDRVEMIDDVVIKLIEEIRDVASNTYVPDFFSGEDWDDEE